MGSRRGKKKNFQKQAKKKPPPGKVILFPFLENKETINSIKKQFRVMLIMRGIPGSGKTTLVEKIVSVYENAVVCSADHYFMENGQYVWSAERRYYAHQYSMKLAEKCCEMNCPLVVIDNTNITEAEATFYFQIALKYSYVTVLVTPQTPWRFDPVQLEKYGKHGLSLKALCMKVKLFQDIIPEFYAWFIAHSDAKALKELTLHHFRECLKHLPHLNAEISKLHLEEQNVNEKQKDPVQREKYGKHSVPLKALRMKVKLFQDRIPEFYAWFICHPDAKALKELALHHFRECLKHFPHLNAEISKLHLEEQKLDEKQKDYESENHFTNILKKSLFCIAKNCCKGKLPGSIDFHSRDHVQNSCGKVFVLQVTKILVTPDFLVCCVELDSQETRNLFQEFEAEKCQATNEEDLYKVVGKDTREERKENDLVSMSGGYTDDEEMHQSCLNKVEARLSLMLSQIKPGVGIDTGNGNDVAQSFAPGKSHSLSEEVEVEDYEKKVEQKLSNENLRDSQVMAAAAASDAAAAADDDDAAADNAAAGDESHFAAGAFRVAKKADCETEDSVRSERNDFASQEEKFATILLTEPKTDDQTDGHEIVKQILETERSKNCKSSEKISTDHSNITYFQNGVCIIHLKEKFKIEAIFSGRY